jgi:hypothetical protein
LLLQAYHVECIDKWLLRNNRHCPVCKRRVIARRAGDDDETDSSEENEEMDLEETNDRLRLIVDVDESTRLLTHVAARSSNSRNNEDNASLLTEITNLNQDNNSNNNNNTNNLNNNPKSSSLSNLHGAAIVNHETSSVNSQMMNASLRSNYSSQLMTSATCARLLCNQSLGSKATNVSLSKYGSISSMSQLNGDNNQMTRVTDHDSCCLEEAETASSSQQQTNNAATTGINIVVATDTSGPPLNLNVNNEIDLRETPYEYYTPYENFAHDELATAETVTQVVATVEEAAAIDLGDRSTDPNV